MRADTAEPDDHDERVANLRLALETEELDVARELLRDDVVAEERHGRQCVWGCRVELLLLSRVVILMLRKRLLGRASRASCQPV